MGRVTDAQNAAVPGANITVTNVETSARFVAVSGQDGLYAVPFLPAGLYRLTAEANGFSRHSRDGIQISTNQRVALDIRLEVGQISSTVTVTADAGQLQTETASVGQVVGASEIDNMPSNSRTPLMLAQLSFGVVATGNPQYQRPFYANGPSAFSMGGAPAQTNAILLDGAAINTQNMQAGYSPPMDAVLEVKTESFQADAAYGATGGGTVNMVLKSGTNALHGTVYEFNQVSALAATPFFTNAAGQSKPVTRYNQWGVQATGPVVIPKVFNGRNRLLFLFAYDGIRESLPTPFVETVATPAVKNGDFSALLPAGAVIHDPATGVRSGSLIQRQPFPNNVIPSHRLNPVGKSYMQFYPAPNMPGTALGQNNYTSRTIRSANYNNELARLDFNLSDRHKLFWAFRRYEFIEYRWDLFDNIATGNTLARRVWGSTLDDVYTLSATTVLNVRLNWTHYNQILLNRSDGFDMTTLGFPASLAAAATTEYLPTVDFGTGLTNSNVTASNGALRPFGEGDAASAPFNNYQLFASVTKSAGAHTVKFGGDFRLNRYSPMNYGYGSGRYVVNGVWSRGPFSNSPRAPIGQEWADLLLGLADSGQFDQNVLPTFQSGYYSLFLQDDFRVTPTLTLNLGLRWERESAATERYNRNVRGFDTATPNAITAQAKAAYARNPVPDLPVSQFNPVGGLLFADSSHRGFYATPALNFSPRFGFAWKPAFLGSRSVIRGGGGVFFFPLGIVGANQTGFSQTTSLVSSLDGGLTPNVTLSNPFPQGILPAPSAAPGLETFLGKNVGYYNLDPSNGYSVRWSLSAQHELTANLLAEIGYMGNHAVHMSLAQPVNFVPASFLSTLPYRDQPTINRLTGLVANPFAGLVPGTNLNGSSVALSQLLVRFPQFTGVSADGIPAGNSYFHMFNARLQKRLSKGLQMQASYSFSKLLERRSWLNASDTVLEKRPANADHPQRLVFSATYELPFGKGRRFAPSNSILDRVVGGWLLAPIYTYQMGAPVAWGNVIYYGGDLRWNAGGVDGAFDIERFNRLPAQQLANNIRTFPTQFGNLRADRINHWDVAVIKNNSIIEKVRLQFRCEFFNALNRVNFGAPNVTPTSSAFGRITSQANSERRIQLSLRLLW
jgi:hypothetical protein